jgi:predicted dehydrogenase
MSKEQPAPSRRTFIQTTAVATSALAFTPARSMGKTKEIRLGFVGLGRQGIYLVESFLQLDGVKVVSGCDVDESKRVRFQNRVGPYYKNKGMRDQLSVVEDYRKLLKDPELDAVVISTPDHWHALTAIDAANAGKHIYLEKPLTFTIYEGQKLVEAVRRNKVVLSVGSMQRSEPLFQHAIKTIHEGGIGDIEKVSVWLGSNPHPKPYDLPAEPVPDGLNWDLWSGPAPVFSYNHQLNPPISIDPPVNEQLWGAWRWYQGLGGGLMTDWGAHMIDVAQWGLQRDRSGPVKIIPAGSAGKEFLTFVYDDGIEMSLEPIQGNLFATKFRGKEGWVEVGRGHFAASDEKLNPSFKVEPGDKYWVRHHLDFLEAIKEGREPLVPVETGHRTCTVCTLGNIAHELKEPLIWDPDKESFPSGTAASERLHYPYREGFRKL